MAPRTKRMPHTVYLNERQHLAKYEQTNYENYEKTILTLSSAFLAFSISFLALFEKSSDIVNSIFPNVVSKPYLFTSWILFALSVLSILSTFLISALALRREIHKLEEALEDYEALRKSNYWTPFVYVLYLIAGISFSSGVIFLILFCIKNISII